MDWNKMGAIGSAIGGVCAMAMLGMTLWPSIKSRLDTKHQSQPQNVKIISTFLLISFALSAIAIYGAWKGPDYTKWPSEKQEEVYGKSFLNEAVELDGKIFDHCRFTGVTFIYRGTGAVTFKDSPLSGVLAFKTNNQAVRGWIQLSALFNMSFSSTVQMFTEDDNGNLTPIK